MTLLYFTKSLQRLPKRHIYLFIYFLAQYGMQFQDNNVLNAVEIQYLTQCADRPKLATCYHNVPI